MHTPNHQVKLGLIHIFLLANTFRVITVASAGGSIAIWGIDNATAIIKASEKGTSLTPEQIEQNTDLQVISASSSKTNVYTKYTRPDLPPDLYAELKFNDDNTNGILEAHESSYLEVTITNKGGGEAQGLGLTVTDNLKSPDITIGSIKIDKVLKPGKSTSVKIPISTNKNIKTEQHRFEIAVTEYFGYDMDKAFLVLNTYEYQAPLMTFAGFEIFDDTKNSMAIAKDGKLQAGEQVEVKVVLQNTKPGIARNVTYSITSKNTDVFVKNNNGSLNDVKGGDIVEFTFILSPNKKVTTTDKLPVYLTVNENVQGKQIDNFQLPIVLNAKPTEPTLVKVNSDFESLKKNIATFEYTSEKFITKVGTVTDISNAPKTNYKRANSVGLIIGIENYKNLPPAPYADNDADAMKNYFKNTLGLEQVVIYKNEEVAGLFFDDIFNTEYGDLQKAIIKGESDLFVFYSGHGVPDKNGENVYLFPSDGKYERLSTQGYNLNLFYENLNKLGAKSVTVFIDACFSGSSRVTENTEAQNLTGEKAGVKRTPKTVEPWKTNPNFSVFNSSSFTQTSLGFDQSETGLFTYYMCVGMQGEADSNKDRKITLGELRDFVIQKVSETSKKISGEQTPQFNGNADMVIIEY